MRAGWPHRAERGSYRRSSRVSERPFQLGRTVRADADATASVAATAVAAAAAVAAVAAAVVLVVGATRPRLRRLGNQVEPRASRAGYGARRRVGTRRERGR